MSYEAGTVKKSEFSGEYQLAYVDVTIDDATGDVTLSEFDEVFVLSAEIIEDPVANCSSVTAKEDGTTENKINIKMWKSAHTAASADWIDVRLTVLGLLTSNP